MEESWHCHCVDHVKIFPHEEQLQGNWITTFRFIRRRRLPWEEKRIWGFENWVITLGEKRRPVTHRHLCSVWDVSLLQDASHWEVHFISGGEVNICVDTCDNVQAQGSSGSGSVRGSEWDPTLSAASRAATLSTAGLWLHFSSFP